MFAIFNEETNLWWDRESNTWTYIISEKSCFEKIKQATNYLVSMDNSDNLPLSIRTVNEGHPGFGVRSQLENFNSYIVEIVTQYKNGLLTPLELYKAVVEVAEKEIGEDKPDNFDKVKSQALIIAERLLDSEEHSCSSAVPQVAEDAAEIIKELINAIELLEDKDAD